MFGLANELQLDVAMDNLRRKSYSESLKTTLNCYQLSSADSLSGPSSYSALAAQLWFKENKQSPPIPPPPLIQIPLLMPNDTSTQRSETVLVGERISCFVVGGEKRLCLPQILTSVLREFSISEINRACAELHIYCSRCSPDQLEILKVLGILPFNTTQCGLITKTDAERLVSALGVECGLNSTQDLSKCDIKGIQVYHECFGRGDGIFYPELYISPDSPCVACLDCRISFSPSRFVSHSHRGLEKHTCHWGFDPDNWRSYLLVPKDKKCGNQKELESMLKLIKAKFNFDTGSQLRYNRTPLPSGHKRKVGDFGSTPPVKKRMKEEKSDDSVFISPPPPLCFGLPINMRSSAFKPWHSALAQARDFPHHHEALAKVLGPVLHNRVIPDHLLASSNIMPRTELPSKENQFPQVKPEADVQNSSHNVQQERRRSEGDEKRLKEKQTQPTSLSTLVAESRIKEKVEVHTPDKNTKSERVSRDSSTPSLTPKCKEIDEERDKSNRSCDRMSSDSEPKKPSPSKPAYDKTTQIIGTSVDVAAASAMLELSSSGQHRKLSVEKESTSKSINMQYSLASPSRSQVVPLDSSHRLFKWTFDSSSYIISASGTQEIRMLETMLEKGADRQQVVHGLVKMKYRYEEKLDIQERVKRDLEAELDQVKTSKKQRLNEAVETRKALQHEMDLLRNEQSNRSKDVNDALFKIWQQVGDLKRGKCNEITEVDMNKIKTSVLETIEKQVKEQEKMTDQLRVELELERSKRLEAESKLNEMLDGLHGRLPFLMDGHVSNMIRESQKLGEENNLRPSFSRKSLQSLTSLSKKNQESEEYLDVT